MSNKTAKKIGVFTALTMMIGSIVGVGIFFKSNGILRSNDWNGIGTLMAWIIGGLLSLAAAISFAEIGSMKTKKQTGLPAWAEKVGGKKFGYFTRFNYSFYYYGLMGSALAFFSSETLFNVIAVFSSVSIKDIPMYAHVLVGLLIGLGFVALNYFSIYAGGIVQKVTTVIKWIPLIGVGLMGIILATTNEMPNSATHYGESAFTNGQSFKITGMLASIPAVLFAFDSFLSAATLSNKLKGGVSKVPMVVIVGIISSLILYLMIALSAILHGAGNVSSGPMNDNLDGSGILDQIFSKQTAITMGKITTVLLLISTWGVTNGISATGITMIEQSTNSNTIVGAKTLNKKWKHTNLYYGLATYTFWFVLYAVTTIPLKSDSPVDGLSNFSTLFFFGIYGTVILLYTLKREKHETIKLNNILYKIFAWIAIVGIAFFVGYELIYGFFIEAILHPHESSHWGLFAGRSLEMWEASIVFFSMVLLFSAGPFINKWLTKKFESNDVHIDTFA